MQPTPAKPLTSRATTPGAAGLAPWKPSIGFVPNTRPGQYEIILDSAGGAHVVARLYRKPLAPGVAAVLQVQTKGGGRVADPAPAVNAAKGRGFHIVDPATQIDAFGASTALVVSYPVKGGSSYCWGWERPIDGVADAVDIDADAMVRARKRITYTTIGEAHAHVIAALKAKATADWVNLARNTSAAAAVGLESLRAVFTGMGWPIPVDRRAPQVQVQVQAQPPAAASTQPPTQPAAVDAMQSELEALRAELAALRATPPPIRPAALPVQPAPIVAPPIEDDDLDDEDAPLADPPTSRLP